MLKYNPPIYCLQETRFRSKDTNRLKVKEQKGIFMQIITKGEQVAMLISDNQFSIKSYQTKGRALYINKRLNTAI